MINLDDNHSIKNIIIHFFLTYPFSQISSNSRWNVCDQSRFLPQYWFLWRPDDSLGWGKCRPRYQGKLFTFWGTPTPLKFNFRGMFAISLEFFSSIGSYDNQMTRWGGENVDLAIRVKILLFLEHPFPLEFNFGECLRSVENSLKVSVPMMSRWRAGVVKMLTSLSG